MPLFADVKSLFWAPPSAETWLFVDVDGVFNVCVADPGRQMRILNQRNIDQAVESVSEKADRLVATCLRQCGDDGTTYAELVAHNDNGVSDVLVARFATLVRAAGKRRKLILTSEWRAQEFAQRLRVLERAVSRHLGETFTFDARTPVNVESGRPADRLQTIGDFIVTHGSSAPLRVLVLDDFSASAISAWKYKGYTVNRAEDAEMYLQDRAGAGAAVKVVHTYDEWTTAGAVTVQVGSGLTTGHLAQAHAFLADTKFKSHSCDEAAEPPLGLPEAAPTKRIAMLRSAAKLRMSAFPSMPTERRKREGPLAASRFGTWPMDDDTSALEGYGRFSNSFTSFISCQKKVF